RARAWRDPVHPSPDAPRTDSLPHRASTEPLTFVHRTGVWDLADRPRVVGILNLTPDSFYDGGRFQGADSALARADAMASEGADALDVGAQSTRPGSVPVGPEEEWERLGPILRSILARVPLPVSIDTYHLDVARRALACGASIVNDVSGLGVAPAVADEVARAGAGLGASVAAYVLGARIFRTHDVRETVAALHLAETLLNSTPVGTAEQGAGA